MGTNFPIDPFLARVSNKGVLRFGTYGGLTTTAPHSLTSALALAPVVIPIMAISWLLRRQMPYDFI